MPSYATGCLIFLTVAQLGWAHENFFKRNEPNTTIQVMFEKHIPTGKSALTAWTVAKDDGGKSFLGRVCEGHLVIDNSTLSVEHSNAIGDGKLHFGDQDFGLDFNPDVSGGITCTRMYSNSHAVNECYVPIHLEAKILPTVPRDKLPDCFAGVDDPFFIPSTDGILMEDVDTTDFDTEDIIGIEDSNQAENGTEALEARQIIPGCPVETHAYPFNDGSPYKLVKVQQATGNLRCASNAGCEIGQGQTHSVTHTASFSGGWMDWFSAGYSVSFTSETSEIYTCHGNPGDHICIWNKKRYQQHLALGQRRVCGNFRESSGRYWIQSPHNSRGWYECGQNNCRERGSWHFDNEGGGVW